MTTTKLFVGNLSFKTRDPDLAKFFETIGTVKSANIIAHGPRSMGYGFVEFEKPEDAAKSIEELNKKELDGRAINVVYAKPRAPGDQRPQRPFRGGFRGGYRGGFRRQNAAPANVATAAGGAAAGAPVPRGRPRPPRGPAASVAPVTGAAGTAPVPAGGEFQPRPRGPRRGPRAPRPPRSTGPPSTTTLFVANLPFIVDDEGLLEIFEGMNVKEAHVVRRVNNRSKGYGFVSFENEADQRRALETIDKTVVEGRSITVRPALTPITPQQPAASSPGVVPPVTDPSTAAPATPVPPPATTETPPKV